VDTGSITLSLRLEHSAESADIARRAVRAVLGRDMNLEFVDDAVLCTSEIVTNAIVHTDLGCQLQMQFDAAAGRLRIEVSDGSPPRPLVANAVDVHRPGGRGLQIVEEAASRWGSHPTAGGKVVWFEMDQPGLRAAVDVHA
jgi:hypothetical protein